MAGSGSQSRRFPAIDVPIWNGKKYSLFHIRTKTGKIFLFTARPTVFASLRSRSRFRHEPQAEQDDARAHHVKHALI
jgi:hypothetical protein